MSVASKRMISADIFTSDSFITMSHKAQSLYIQCILSADDDGLLDNMTSLMRSLEVKKPVLDELISKKFILDLGDEIFCIKHWFINNNAIQKDRYHPTNYKEKLDKLILKENKSYTLKEFSDFTIETVYCDTPKKYTNV